MRRFYKVMIFLSTYGNPYLINKIDCTESYEKLELVVYAHSGLRTATITNEVMFTVENLILLEQNIITGVSDKIGMVYGEWFGLEAQRNINGKQSGEGKKTTLIKISLWKWFEQKTKSRKLRKR